MRAIRQIFTGTLRRYNLFHCASFPASNFDGGEEAYCGGLNSRASSVDRRRSRGGYFDSTATTRTASVPTSSRITFTVAGKSAISKKVVAPILFFSVVRVESATYVRARKSIRSDRDLKGEPPLQKRGLPLAASSLAGDRVPLRPRKAVKHPGTSGTVGNVTAPRAHDGSPRIEEV